LPAHGRNTQVGGKLAESATWVGEKVVEGATIVENWIWDNTIGYFTRFYETATPQVSVSTSGSVFAKIEIQQMATKNTALSLK
jgi:hypothetical protein